MGICSCCRRYNTRPASDERFKIDETQHKQTLNQSSTWTGSRNRISTGLEGVVIGRHRRLPPPPPPPTVRTLNAISARWLVRSHFVVSGNGQSPLALALRKWPHSMFDRHSNECMYLSSFAPTPKNTTHHRYGSVRL